MVLASCRDRQLFGWPLLGRPCRDRVARHALGDGHGGGLLHDRGWTDRADAVSRWQAAGRGRQGGGARVCAVCRRSGVVDGGGEGSAGEAATAALRRSASEHSALTVTAVLRMTFGAGPCH